MRTHQAAVIVTIMTSLVLLRGGLRAQDGGPKREQLQQKVDALKIGVSDLSMIERLFGKPESLRKGVDWHENGVKRPMHYAQYPANGLSFALFTNPSQLYSITIETKDVVSHAIKIGDSLQQVRKTLAAEGEWGTTDEQDWWWLEFKKHGVKVGFERDKTQKKYPIKLAAPETVTRIELYDTRVTFH